jgi:hypothetical protein
LLSRSVDPAATFCCARVSFAALQSQTKRAGGGRGPAFVASSFSNAVPVHPVVIERRGDPALREQERRGLSSFGIPRTRLWRRASVSGRRGRWRLSSRAGGRRPSYCRGRVPAGDASSSRNGFPEGRAMAVPCRTTATFWFAVRILHMRVWRRAGADSSSQGCSPAKLSFFSRSRDGGPMRRSHVSRIYVRLLPLKALATS